MKDALDSLAHVIPSATPSEDEIRQWNSLPRDEQLRLMRAALAHPDCATATADTMSEVLADAQSAAATRRAIATLRK